MIQYSIYPHRKFGLHSCKLFSYLLILWLILNLLPCDASAEIYGRYVGWKSCNECHTEISDRWRQTRHANAFASLLKSRQQDLPDCLQCHVVGYDSEGGFLDQELTLELAGVQCESCHGPGKRHSDLPDDDRNNLRAPDEKLCRTCHTTGQDPNFDYRKKAALVHGKETTNTFHHLSTSQLSNVDSTLFIEKTVYEFAQVEEGTPVIAYARIKNSGKGVVSITDVISS
ncbi:multiheme c-type cytochrome [Thermodesulfobacteriota bacterium]